MAKTKQKSLENAKGVRKSALRKPNDSKVESKVEPKVGKAAEAKDLRL